MIVFRHPRRRTLGGGPMAAQFKGLAVAVKQGHRAVTVEQPGKPVIDVLNPPLWSIRRGLSQPQFVA